ncbi:shikimate dehydrogenase family protein [Ramlibacter sp.]|uniref:shikimate dehydrogenase family protein n=1 Tax=Ramlibacter sp. TaxID=1917967 RepID=UPI003D0F884C
MNIDGNTGLIAHLGWPTHAFKAPLIYNPYFESAGVNAVVVPMGCRPQAFEDVLRSFFRLENARGALVTMPHKVSVVGLLDVASPAVEVAGACNAVKRLADGRLMGEQFDGEGFVRGMRSKGLSTQGARALVVGCGGVGSAIAAALAGAGAEEVALYDIEKDSERALAQRLAKHFPRVRVATGSNDPAGFDLVVNATALGMNPGDPLPLDVSRLAASTFVGDVVMSAEVTEFLRAAGDRGCRVQVGTDMLFEMIPPYLEFFGFPTTTADRLRDVARLRY